MALFTYFYLLVAKVYLAGVYNNFDRRNVDQIDYAIDNSGI